MTDPLSKQATATEIARAVMSGKVKASAVIEATLTRIETSEPTVNAFTDVLAARARKRAAEIDAGTHRGPLAGVPFAVKNLFDIRGLPTRAGSKINVDGPIAARDGSLVRKLEAAGAILVGGLNMGEYAYDFTGENAHYGPSAQSARHDAHDRRLVGRLGCGGGGGRGAVVAGLRHQRLDPRAVLAVRPVRAEADLRPAEPRRLLSLRRRLRPSRAARPLGRGSRAVVRRHAGLGSRRSGVHRPAGRSDGAGPERRHRWPAHRHRRRLFRPRRRARGVRGGGHGRQGAQCHEDRRDPAGRRGALGGLRHHRHRGRPAPSAAPA